jgi:hypothetical protein
MHEQTSRRAARVRGPVRACVVTLVVLAAIPASASAASRAPQTPATGRLALETIRLAAQADGVAIRLKGAPRCKSASKTSATCTVLLVSRLPAYCIFRVSFPAGNAENGSIDCGPETFDWGWVTRFVYLTPTGRPLFAGLVLDGKVPRTS